METACLAASLRTRLAEAWRDRHRHSSYVTRDHLELVALADGALVDVPGEDELGAGVDERSQDVRPPGDRLLARAPRRPDQVMVERDDPQRTLRRLGQELARPAELRSLGFRPTGAARRGRS